MSTVLESPSHTEVIDRGERYCVIGAGAAGLTAAKNLLEQGFAVDVIEREDQVGGNWNYVGSGSSAYRSIHLITSKPYIQFTDYPMPAEYPTYLGQQQALAYLRSYAEHFGVIDDIEFETSVEWVDRQDGTPNWLVTVRTPHGVELRRYAGLVVANGHNWSPRYPNYPGTFDGVAIHSADYKVPDLFVGKRVLVVGSGTSGCDIAVESGQNADKTFLSVRRGCYIWPKYIFGIPTDVFYEFLLKFHMPRPVVRFFGKPLLRVNSAGSPTGYGLPRPDHKLLEEHFVLNSTLLYHLGHGDVSPKPDIARLCGDRVRFVDGTEERIDVIVYATGYNQAEFPFIDRKHLNWTRNIPDLHLHAFHPDYDNLFVIGYFQTSTGNWPIMDYQSQIMARYLYLLRNDPQRVATFRKAKSAPVVGAKLNGGIKFYDSERHWLQVEHVSFRSRLRKLAKSLAVDDGTPATEHQRKGMTNVYHTIVKGKLRSTFEETNRGNHRAVVEQFAKDGEHWFSGTHALSGRRSGPAAVARWHERLARLLPDLTFQIHGITVSGWPWATTAVVEWTDSVHDRQGNAYSNAGVHVIKLRWGKIAGLRIYCDTARLAEILTRIEEQGVAEAGAEPLTVTELVV